MFRRGLVVLCILLGFNVLSLVPVRADDDRQHEDDKYSCECAPIKATEGVPIKPVTLKPRGGHAPLTFSAVGLPAGLSISGSGTISGTPAVRGIFTYTVTITNKVGRKLRFKCMIKVEGPKLKLSCAASTAQVGNPYSSALIVRGGTAPYRFAVTGGALPPGLALSVSSGAIIGTPTTAGSFSYTARVTDAKAASAMTSCSIKVTSSAPALTLSCASPAGELGSAYSSALGASGGVSPYAFSISAGSLPSGLALNSATGAITGTPTASGTFTYTGKVVDAAGTSATTSCRIAVSAPIKLSCASSAAQVGSTYSSALNASGGTSPYTFSIATGSLPPGLTLNASTGAITGTPTTAGSYNYTAEVTDKSGATATSSCTISPITVGSCLATSSLTILAHGSSVTAYVPDGSWSAGTTGIQVVPIEPVGSATSIATPNVVNSCAANSSTGQTVCTANNTDVYLLTGTTLNTTLTSGANARAGFSGGSCENCGVAINPSSNTAVITMGLSGAPSGSALQYLDLSSNTFSTPVPASHEVSEDVLWDPTRNLILSPDEQGVYDLFQVGSAGTSEYGNAVSFGEGDSAAEDCSTGIALSSIEFTTSLYIADFSQATFTAGTPGTWSAPQQVQPSRNSRASPMEQTASPSPVTPTWESSPASTAATHWLRCSFRRPRAAALRPSLITLRPCCPAHPTETHLPRDATHIP